MKFLPAQHALQVFAVTPCVGVWIEICVASPKCIIASSLPAWECGLKYIRYRNSIYINVSLPAWECGLKFKSAFTSCMSNSSLPAWECGLKYYPLLFFCHSLRVTPCVGVWIEIFQMEKSAPKKILVTPCVGVWIEIHTKRRKAKCGRVTPCVGVWIEISLVA